MENEKSFFNDYQNLMITINTLSKSADNPFFKSKYVELKTVLNEAKRVCLDNNFVFYQYPEVINDKPVLTTILRHASGEEIKGTVPIVAKDATDPQKIGGGLTYMRRYSLTAMLGIEEEDDDGNAGAEIKTVKPVAKPQPTGTIETVMPFENQPRVKTIERKVGDVCPNCGGKFVLSPKTGKVFCENKCWLTKN